MRKIIPIIIVILLLIGAIFSLVTFINNSNKTLDDKQWSASLIEEETVAFIEETQPAIETEPETMPAIVEDAESGTFEWMHEEEPEIETEPVIVETEPVETTPKYDPNKMHKVTVYTYGRAKVMHDGETYTKSFSKMVPEGTVFTFSAPTAEGIMINSVKTPVKSTPYEIVVDGPQVIAITFYNPPAPTTPTEPETTEPTTEPTTSEPEPSETTPEQTEDNPSDTKPEDVTPPVENTPPENSENTTPTESTGANNTSSTDTTQSVENQDTTQGSADTSTSITTEE